MVDDHAGFRAEVRRFLESLGYDVVAEAVDGASAVVAARKFAPDIIVLDVVLPDMDGFGVARQLAARGVTSRVILVSTREASDYGSRVASCGAVGFIAKADLSSASFQALAAC